MRNKDDILQAIKEEMGVNIGQIRSHSRKRKLVYARFIYAHHRYAQCGEVEVIAEEVGRDRNTIDYYIAKYHVDYKFNKLFRGYCDRVEAHLKGGNTNDL